jgi:biotin carboxyl carrier protein
VTLKIMKFDVRISGKTRTIELHRDANGWRISLDGAPLDGDAIEVAPHTFSILLNGQSHDVRVAPAPDGTLTLQTGNQEFTAEVVDPRAWRGRRHGAIEAEGRQQVTASMPGKVVRLLVQPGDKVQAGQGLLVVEAMKMQNEVRSPKTGTVERLLVQENQPVNAGQVLVWID